MATRNKALYHFDSRVHACQLYVTFDDSMFWEVKELCFWVIRQEVEVFEVGHEFTQGQPVVDLVPGGLNIYGTVRWDPGAGVLYHVDDSAHPFRLIARAYDPIGDVDYETSLLYCHQVYAESPTVSAQFGAGTWVKWHRSAMLGHVTCASCGYTDGHDMGCEIKR